MILILISLAVFLLLQMVPGDVAVALLGDGASPEDYQALRVKLGLDKPVFVQYLRWASNLLRGDFGTSLVSRYPVAHLYLQRLPYTLQLTLCGMLFAVVTAIPAESRPPSGTTPGPTSSSAGWPRSAPRCRTSGWGCC